MKKIVILSLIIISTMVLNAQVDFTLKINHRLGLADFALDQIAENSLGQSYKTSRLEYYISRFSIVHDGGIETTMPLEVIALVQPGVETSTLIPLGNYDITTVEKIKFYIGVYPPLNNEDPALYDESHPLGLKSPSMHWGWASGYRFVVYEGFGGVDFSQNFQLHGLGNTNYFRQEQTVISEMVDGVMVLNLNADYTEALRDINVSTGVVSHSETGSALKLLQNFRDHVFGNYFASLDPIAAQLQFTVFPNPTENDQVQVNFENVTGNYEIRISNATGQLIQTLIPVTDGIINLQVPEAGIYFISVLAEGKLVETKRIVRI